MRWLPLLLLATIGLLFPACEGNNPSQGGGADTGDVVTVKMRNIDNGNVQIVLNAGGRTVQLIMDSGNNFFVYTGQYSDEKGIKDVGEKKLSSIKDVPTTGYASTVAITPKHGYVLRVEPIDVYGINGHKSLGIYYWKLYVVDYIYDVLGGIIGAEVQYCEWNLEQ